MEEENTFKAIDDYSNEFNSRIDEGKIYMSISEIEQDGIDCNFFIMDKIQAEKFRDFLDNVLNEIR